MLKNWKVSAWLASPLAGDAPALDAILAWELAKRMGMKHHNKTTRATPIDEILDVPIPLAKRDISGDVVYCCSNPIVPEPTAPEWVERTTKRFDTSEIALLLDPSQRKNLLTASGPYKSRYAPVRVRLVPRVCWFVRGDRKEMNKLLKSVYAIGSHRNIGYGLVWKWEYEEVEADYSIYAMCRGKPVLMKTIPLGDGVENVCGYRRGYGAYRPPYWHPERQREVAIPC